MVNDVDKVIIILEQISAKLELIRKEYQGDPNDISELRVRLDRAIQILKNIK